MGTEKTTTSGLIEALIEPELTRAETDEILAVSVDVRRTVLHFGLVVVASRARLNPSARRRARRCGRRPRVRARRPR